MPRHFLEVVSLHEDPNRPLTRITHEYFHCNRGFAAATSLSVNFARLVGRLAPCNLDILWFGRGQTPHADAGKGVSPQGFTCPSRNATARFRHEPS
jgi:hypothetical protein